MQHTHETALTAEECLVYELTQYRMDLRDLAINTECDDCHNASSHNYFRRELNESVFYLPPAPLSGQDDHYLSFAMKEKRNAVISTFNRLYSSEAIISFVEEMVTDTGKGKVYKFKPAMFVEWLEKTNRMNEDAFVDESMLKYKRSLIRTYLEENNFLTSLESENPSPENPPVIPPPTADEPNDADIDPAPPSIILAPAADEPEDVSIRKWRQKVASLRYDPLAGLTLAERFEAEWDSD